MLTKKEYEQIEQDMEKYVDGTWIVETMRTGARECKNYVLALLRVCYVQKEEQQIDCDAINKALLEGKIIVAKSEHGIAIIPANSRKSDHDIMFENCMNNAESKMKEIETEFYFKEGGRHAGMSTYKALEAAKHMSETMATLNKGCYVKSDETEKEQWDRLDGHGKCMRSAADVAYELQKKDVAEKTLDENGKYKYSVKEQDEIAVRLENLENKMKSIEERESEHDFLRLGIGSLFHRISAIEERLR